MSRDSSDCEVMNELFDSGEKPERKPLIHWKPVAIVNQDGSKVRDLTKQEQLEWIKQQKLKER